MDDPIEIVARAIVASDFDGDETVYDTMSDEMKAHFLENARAALLALREPMSELRDWMAIWDRVCDAADPDDAAEPPPWEEARKAVGPDMDPAQFPSADHFRDYMHASLVYLVQDLLHAKDHALQTQEKGNE